MAQQLQPRNKATGGDSRQAYHGRTPCFTNMGIKCFLCTHRAEFNRGPLFSLHNLYNGPRPNCGPNKEVPGTGTKTRRIFMVLEKYHLNTACCGIMWYKEEQFAHLGPLNSNSSTRCHTPPWDFLTLTMPTKPSSST